MVKLQDSITKPFPRMGLRLLLFALLSSPLAVAAQKMSFENFTIQNGLPQNTVNDLCQDSSGYIWFATQMGAARFDGYEFTYYNTGNGLPDNMVNCLICASDSRMWFGTEGGVACYNGSEFLYYTETEGLVNNRVDRLLEDKEGNIWAASAYGISVITGDSIYSYSKGNGLTDNTITAFFADSRGRVHVACYPELGLSIFDSPDKFENHSPGEGISDILETNSGDIWYATQGDGILVLGDDQLSKLGYDHGLTDETVISIMEDHEGRIWCGTYAEGIFLYENGIFRKYPHHSGRMPLATSIMADSKKRIWILDYQDGIWLIDGDEYRNISMSNNLVFDLANDIMEDSYGNVWIATLGGASKYGKAIFEVFDKETGLPENNVISTFFDSHSRLWMGTYGHLLYRKASNIYMLTERSGFPEGWFPLSFAEDRNKNIYVGTDQGLLYFNGRNLRPVDLWDESDEIQFFSLLTDSDNKLWCGTNQGLYIIDGGKLILPKGASELKDPQVNAFYESDNMVFCATESGVAQFDMQGKLVASIGEEEGLPSEICNDISGDEEGNLWVATDKGLVKIQPGSSPFISSFTLSGGKSSSSFYFLEFNDRTTLWLGTERGAYKFNTETSEFTYYGIEDGFYPLDTYRGAISRGKEKELWMGTVSGLVHYRPAHDKTDLIPPDLILHPPLIKGEAFMPDSLNGSHIPELAYNRNSVVFNFTGIQMTSPSQNRFSYILENYDEKWSDPEAVRLASYKKLPNGQYIFRVRAFNADGIQTEHEATFAFAIKPPFWKTIWFILLEVIAGLGIIYGTIKYRERQLIREKRILESKVRERTQEIEDQKIEIESQRDEIVDKNKEITDSIHYASQIQQAVLPGKLLLEKVLPDHFILFKPRDIVSGDFYWVDRKNDRIVVCAADCTGHGVPGAFMSMLGLTFLNQIVNKDEILKASEILNHLRRSIISAMSHKDKQARDGMDLALVVIDKQLNILEYAGAYNPLVIARNGELLEFKADKMPIGKHVGEEGPFTNHKVLLETGDMIYLFSDGFPDQFGGEKGGKYKARPFKRFLQNASNLPVKEQLKLLEKELHSWMGNEDQVDDILIMGIRY